jgi:hypothetical protein
VGAIVPPGYLDTAIGAARTPARRGIADAGLHPFGKTLKRRDFSWTHGSYNKSAGGKVRG